MASDLSIRGDLSSIRFEFATKHVSSMIRVPGNNLSDHGTKPDGQLTQTLNLLFESGSLSKNFEDAMIETSDLSAG